MKGNKVIDMGDSLLQMSVGYVQILIVFFQERAKSMDTKH